MHPDRFAGPHPGAPTKICDTCRVVDEANHRIANHLSLLASYVRRSAADSSLRGAQPSLDEVQLVLQGVGVQIDAVAILHRSLTARAASPTGDMGDHLRKVCAPLMSTLSDRVKFVEDFSAGCVVAAEAVLPLTQIAVEVLTNAIKHAGPTETAARISASCRQDGAGGFLLEIADNGPGLPESFDPTTDQGLGFRLLHGLGRQIGASITFESTPDGLCFRLWLPSGPTA